MIHFMSELVATSRRDEIGVLTIQNPPVNAIGTAVAVALGEALAALEGDDSIHAIVLIGSGRTFIAGADIREFLKLTLPPLNPVLNAIENCTKPVIAAIHGNALGGGLETAMACHYRVAVADAQVGQPEVKLGLIPGAGGTQRLPRLAGFQKAMRMCISGEPVSAQTALADGIIDEIVAGDLLDGAVAFARRGLPVRRTRDRVRDPGLILVNIEGDLIAPRAALEAIKAAATMPFEEGLRREAEFFNQCLHSDQSKALIHVFFGEREVAKKHGAGALESNAALVERLTVAINERRVADLLSDALSATDLDILAIHACGYPRWLGGPMWQAGYQ